MHRNAEVESSDRPAHEYDRQYNTGVLSACGSTGLFTANSDSSGDAGVTGVEPSAAPPIHEFSAEPPPSDCSGGSIGLQAAASVCTDWPGPGTQCDVISSDDGRAVGHESVIHKSAVNTGNCVDSFLSDGWSELRYVDMSIDGISGVIRALDDSGAQVCLVRAEVIAALNLPRIGKVMLRDFLGNSHQAEVVTLQMKLANADTFVPVVCAVCDRLSNDLLLGTDVVDRLNRIWLSDQSQMPMNDGNVCDVGMNGNVNIDVMNNGITDVTSPVKTDENDNDVGNDNSEDDDAVLNLDDVACDKSQNVADAEQLALEQQHDKSLAMCFSLAKRNRAGYFIRDSILYCKDKILGHEVEQLCLLRTRRPQAIRLAHHSYGGHLSA